MILTLAGQSQWLSHIYTWNIQVSSTGFAPMTSVMPVQCSDQLSYEVIQTWAGQIFGIMCSLERNEFKHEPNKLTCSHLSGFIAQLVRALHRHHWGHGFKFHWRLLNFSDAHVKQSLRLSSKCEDHFFNSSLNHTSQIFLSLLTEIIFYNTIFMLLLICSFDSVLVSL